MKNLDEILRFYAISDDDLIKPSELLSKCEQALKGKITCFQVRNKAKNYDFSLLKDLKNLCDLYEVPLVINDDLDLAIRLNASGVHLGWSDFNANLKIPENMFLGISASNYEEALKGVSLGADYLGVGAIFQTNTKKDAKVINKDDLIKIMQEINIPKVAIGGINLNNIKDLKAYEIKNVCFVSAIFKDENIENNCEKLWTEISLL